jgi:hypothetical protein
MSRSKLKMMMLPVIALLAMACDEIDGTTTVKRPVIYNLKPGSAEKSQIPPGNYKTVIERKKDTLIQIELKGPSKKEYEVKLSVPKDLDLPENGNLTLPAAMTGQPFDVFVDVLKTVERSQRYQEWQSCTYQEQERFCYVDNQGRQRCEYRYVTRWGHQYVEYFFRETSKQIRVDLGSDQESESLAHFYSEKRWREKIIVREDLCR